MLKRTVIAACITAALSSTAFAAQFGAPGESGFYGGLGIGRSDADVTAPGISGDDRDTSWKAFAGYQVNRYFAIEGGYIDLGQATAAGPGGTLSLDTKAWQAAVVGSLPLSQQFAFTGKLGVARVDTDAGGVVGGVPVANSDHNTDATYGLGLRYDLTKAFGVRGEWERFRNSSGPIGGKNDVDVYSISGIYRFW